MRRASHHRGVARQIALSDDFTCCASRMRRVQVLSSAGSRGVRRRDGSRYATLAGMQRTDVAPLAARFPQVSAAWLSRRWYYTPKAHHAYSVRQVSPGDRRLLAEFALALARTAPERERASANELSEILFEHVILAGSTDAVGFAALENTTAGDRVIGVCACAPARADGAAFRIAVSDAYRDEQIGRNLLGTLVRHARRIGISRLVGEMHWSNRPMQTLALSMGFLVEPVPRDRNLRRVVLALK
jgi:GNAT superfamily N-acetyltransferase